MSGKACKRLNAFSHSCPWGGRSDSTIHSGFVLQNPPGICVGVPVFKISKCFEQGLSQKDLYIGIAALKGPQLSVQAVDSLFENLGLNSYP